MSKTRFAIIGAGNIAAAYAAAFKQCPALELIAIADINAENSSKIAAGTNARIYRTYKELYECEPFLNAVIVSTPPNLHEEISCFFLNKGISVLCEKPLCTNLFGAVQIASAALKSSAVFAMASKFRYCRDLNTARDIIGSGTLGKILQVENSFNSTVDMSNRWNSNREIAGGGVLIDNGTHSVDIVRFLIGPIIEVFAIDGGNTSWLDVEENVIVLAKTVSETVATIDLSWGIDKSKPYFVSVYGTDGTLHIGWRESKYKLHKSQDWIIFGDGYDKIEAFTGKLCNFANAVAGKESLLTNIDDALASVVAIDAAYRSLETRQWQPVRQLEVSAITDVNEYSTSALSAVR